MFSIFIFDSRVEEGMPSLDAAPNGPATRPLLSINASSIAPFCCVANVGVCGPPGCNVAMVRDLDLGPESHCSSMYSAVESEKMTARSTTFCSSRTLPGQSYDWSNSRLLLPIRLILLHARWAKR